MVPHPPTPAGQSSPQGGRPQQCSGSPAGPGAQFCAPGRDFCSSCTSSPGRGPSAHSDPVTYCVTWCHDARSQRSSRGKGRGRCALFPPEGPEASSGPPATYSSRSASEPRARQGDPHPPARVTRAFPRGPPGKKQKQKNAVADRRAGLGGTGACSTFSGWGAVFCFSILVAGSTLHGLILALKPSWLWGRWSQSTGCLRRDGGNGPLSAAWTFCSPAWQLPMSVRKHDCLLSLGAHVTGTASRVGTPKGSVSAFVYIQTLKVNVRSLRPTCAEELPSLSQKKPLKNQQLGRNKEAWECRYVCPSWPRHEQEGRGPKQSRSRLAWIVSRRFLPAARLHFGVCTSVWPPRAV